MEELQRRNHGTHGKDGKRKEKRDSGVLTSSVGSVSSVVSFLSDDPFVFELRMVSEVDKQTQAKAGRLEIVMDLSPVGVVQMGGLQLNDDPLKADEVRQIALFEGSPLVREGESDLWDERNALQTKLELQALLVHRLKEPAPLLLIDLKAGAEEAVRVLLVEQFHGSTGGKNHGRHRTHGNKP